MQELLAALTVVGIVWGALALVHRKGVAIRAAIRAAMRLEHEFGPETGRAIALGLEAIRHRVSFLERRMDVQEELEDIGILKCSVSGECEYVNQKAQQMLQAPAQEFMAFGWLSLFKESMDLYDQMRHSVQHRLPFRTYATRAPERYYLVAQEVLAADNKTIIGYVTTIARCKNANTGA